MTAAMVVLEPIFEVDMPAEQHGYRPNLSDGVTTTYLWDYANRLIALGSGGATTTYGYDAFGSRVFQSTATTTTLYPFKWYSIASSTGSGATYATTTEYVFNGDTLVSTIDQQFASGTATGTSQSLYIHPDHLGSTNVVTNASGTVVQTLDYYPYGATRISTNVSGADSARKYIGQFADISGLDYLNARYYSPSQGQFISQDPSFLAVGDPTKLKQVTGFDQQAFIADPQLANSYSYGRDNPISMKDPNGNIGYVAAFLTAGEVYGAAQLYYDNYLILRSTTWDRGSYTDAERAQVQGKAYYDFLLESTGLGAVALTCKGNDSAGKQPQRSWRGAGRA